MKKYVLIFCLIVFGHAAILHAQTNDFCTGLQSILASAQLQFRDIKDSVLKANEYAIMWKVNKQLPGSLKCRLVSAMGIRYEAAMYQSTDIENMKQTYKLLNTALANCLLKNGYKCTMADNFYPGLTDYKKVMYTQSITANTADAPPPHVSMEVDYFKASGTYSIIINIWEH